MKKMKLLTLVMAVIVFISCSQEQQIEENLVAVSYETEMSQEEETCLNGPQIYHSIAVSEIARLKTRKTKLVEEIENGNEEATKELERVQHNLGIYEGLDEHILRIPVKFPRPPKGCFEPETYCRIPLDIIEGISITESIKIRKIEIKDIKNNIVGGGTELGESSCGPVELFKSDFTGNATMNITIEIEGFDKIMLPLSVSKN